MKEVQPLHLPADHYVGGNMSPKSDPVHLLKDESGDIAEVVNMGIDESAILRYIVRAHESKSQDNALRALLAGRSLTSEQVEFVKTVMKRFPI